MEGAGDASTIAAAASSSSSSSDPSLASASASIELQYAATSLGLSVVWLRRAAGLVRTATKTEAVAALPVLARAAPAFDVALFDDTDPAVYGYTRSGPTDRADKEREREREEALPSSASRPIRRAVSAFEEDGDDPVFGDDEDGGGAVPDAWDS